MLISLRERFIFVATLKTASTAIELALRPRADICLIESEFGKHMTVAEMMQNLGWLFREVRVNQFFIFGVMRDPIEFALSLFNSHKHPSFVSMPHVSTAGMTFADFIERWVPPNLPQILPQYSRFLDAEGRIGANYIITLDRLPDGLRYVSGKLQGGRFPGLKKLNRSPAGIGPSDLKPNERAWITEHFKDDYRFMDRYCGRPLHSFSMQPDLGEV